MRDINHETKERPGVAPAQAPEALDERAATGVFDDPVAYLARFGLAAEVVADSTRPLHLAA
jgi:hypothetical protein